MQKTTTTPTDIASCCTKVQIQVASLLSTQKALFAKRQGVLKRLVHLNGKQRLHQQRQAKLQASEADIAKQAQAQRIDAKLLEMAQWNQEKKNNDIQLEALVSRANAYAEPSFNDMVATAQSHTLIAKANTLISECNDSDYDTSSDASDSE